jgi:hypothetical protein
MLFRTLKKFEAALGAAPHDGKQAEGGYMDAAQAGGGQLEDARQFPADLAEINVISPGR